MVNAPNVHWQCKSELISQVIFPASCGDSCCNKNRFFGWADIQQSNLARTVSIASLRQANINSGVAQAFFLDPCNCLSEIQVCTAVCAFFNDATDSGVSAPALNSTRSMHCWGGGSIPVARWMRAGIGFPPINACLSAEHDSAAMICAYTYVII